jgi:hypothetical protein
MRERLCDDTVECGYFRRRRACEQTRILLVALFAHSGDGCGRRRAANVTDVLREERDIIQAYQMSNRIEVEQMNMERLICLCCSCDEHSQSAHKND